MAENCCWSAMFDVLKCCRCTDGCTFSVFRKGNILQGRLLCIYLVGEGEVLACAWKARVELAFCGRRTASLTEAAGDNAL